jgi:alpha-tubulin suppressor-like RCC1 family protein
MAYRATGYHPIHEKLLDKPTMVPFQSPLADEEEIISLRAGNYHMVAIVLNKETDQTRVFSFGRNMFGQLGHGDTDDKSQFCPILSLDNIVSIACGSTHTVFADKDGNAYGCGSNKYCKLGDATEDKEFLFPTNINLDNSIPSLRVKEVFCGDHCSAFLSSDKQLVLAGSNTSGQLSHDLFKKDILVVSPPMVLPNVECDLFAGGSQHCLFWGKRNPTTALTSTKRKSKRSARTLSDDGLEGDEENNRPATKKAKTESSSRTENNSFFGGVDLWSPEYLRQGYSGTWLCGFCACRTKDSQDTCEVCGQPRH